jgi:hypothetical protein
MLLEPNSNRVKPDTIGADLALRDGSLRTPESKKLKHIVRHVAW